MLVKQKRKTPKKMGTSKRIKRAKPKIDLSKYFGKVDFGMD